MNHCVIVGRWTKDPEVRYTQGETPMAIAKGTIAVDRRGKDKGADFISVVAFGKTAEHIEKYYFKGMKANIAGHIQTGSYDHKDGYKVYTTDVVIDEIEFGDSKANNDSATQEARAKDNAVEKKAIDEEFMTVSDDDLEGLPFN